MEPQPHTAIGSIKAPTLIVHGTKDTIVMIGSSRASVPQFTAPCTLVEVEVEVEGAQHTFAVHDDPQYHNPRARLAGIRDRDGR